MASPSNNPTTDELIAMVRQTRVKVIEAGRDLGSLVAQLRRRIEEEAESDESQRRA